MALIAVSNEQDFTDSVLQSKKVVLVDFWADWCPPCRAMAPILEVVAEEQDKIADVVKVDIEAGADNQMLAGRYSVSSIPNMVVFKDGKEVDRVIGVTPEAELVKLLKKYSTN